MLQSSSTEGDFDAIVSDDSDLNISSSSDSVDVPLDARFERRVVLWEVHCSLFEDVFDKSFDHSLHWSNLPLDVQICKWMDEVCMTKVVFYELLQRVEEQMPTARVTTGKGSCAPHDRLFLTLSVLAHCPIIRYMGTKFGVPHNSLSVNILRPTLAVLKAELVTGQLQEIN